MADTPLFQTANHVRSILLIFRTGVFQSLCFRGALLLLLLIVERSHADAHDYFAGLVVDGSGLGRL